ncbi:MAG TPA: EAL domain-containing protein [Vicinamibacterales bacterium]|nr:EAL domain-containing protein [Vicinamibacterales bacterium]
MDTLTTHARVAAITLIALVAGVGLNLAGWLEPRQVVELSVLVLAAVAIAATQPATSAERVTMPASFVLDFTALLLFGPHVTMLVASAGTITHELADAERPPVPRRLLFNLAAIITATQAAGLAYGTFGGGIAGFAWPWQALPVAAAVVVYATVRGLSVGVLLPLSTRQLIDREWAHSALQSAPTYIVGASLGVTLAALIQHRMWDVLVLATVPLYFACRAYCGHLARSADDHRRREVVAALDEGMAVIGADGRVTFWSDVLERLLGCSAERALHHSLSIGVPALARTELPRAVNDALATRTARTLECVSLSLAGGLRAFHVKIVPVSGGVTLLWHDVTDRTRTERALKRSEERLAVAAECANDGLWEWDFAGEQFYVSGRWNAMVGLDASPATGRPEDWIRRVHPEDVGVLKVALEATLAGKSDRLELEHRIRHEDGTYRRFLCRGLAVRGTGRRSVRMAGSLTDMTDRASAQDQLRNAVGADALTGLCNRAVFVEKLGRRLDGLEQRTGESGFAVLYLDLDRFKVVNDSLGHMIGDELLMVVSRRLESCLRPGDALARLGGDEFAILLNALGDEQQANAIAFRIQEQLSVPFSIAGREVFTSASIGISFGPAHYTNADDIMRDADTAMYHAKSRGKGRHEVFDADMHARVRDRLDLESDLRQAVSINDFEVHYQPIVSLASGMCIGFESLIRWTRHGKPVSPATFIPVAEELGLIDSVGTWVLQQACLKFADWQQRFPASGLDCITVNVSSRQLMQQNFLRIVEKAVSAAGLQPSHVRLEITETALMDSPHLAAVVLSDLREFGVQIYLDDFGTGCSSLSHLHKLPVDALKIDRSFVTSLLLPDRPAMVESILALARTLKTGVVAEGIETDAQAHELERLGCTHAQGFLFSRPLSPQAAEELIKANQPLGPKRVQAPTLVASSDESAFYSASPFEWPDHIPVGRVALEEEIARVPTRVA